MTWMAWRLQRSVYFFFAAVSAVLVALTVSNGFNVGALRLQWRGAPCHGGDGFAVKYQSYCQTLSSEYSRALSSGPFFHWVALLPVVLLGLFLGANLVAGELDRHSARVAWTQSITRRRWFATKVAVSVASLVALALPLAVTASWWIGATNYTARVEPNGFIYAGWMPIVVGLFSFAVATFAGALLRRPGWALAVALALTLSAGWALQSQVATSLVSLHRVTMRTKTVTKGGVSFVVPTTSIPASAWVVFNGLEPRNWAGAVPNWPEELKWIRETNHCPTPSKAGTGAYPRCLASYHLSEVSLYVANSEYWALQLREGALYLFAAALLLAAALALVRRSRV